MEVALLLGLAALGYALAPQDTRKEREEGPPKLDPKETFISPLPLAPETERVTVVQSATGHNNMVPFFGANVTQSVAPL